MSPPDSMDELFGLSLPTPPTAPIQPTKPSGGPDTRREARVRVKWEARALLADGRVVAVRLRDISESGVGLASEVPLTPHATIRLALAVPDPHTPGRISTVTGTIKTAHVTVSGMDLIYGGIWLNIDGSGSDIIRKSVRKLRG